MPRIADHAPRFTQVKDDRFDALGAGLPVHLNQLHDGRLTASAALCFRAVGHDGWENAPTGTPGSTGIDTVSGGITLTTGGVIPGSGSATGGSGQTAATAPADRRVKFSFNSNLLAGAETADGFAALFRAFYMALDERQMSYLQGTLELVADSSVVDQIMPPLNDLGITATIKEI